MRKLCYGKEKKKEKRKKVQAAWVIGMIGKSGKRSREEGERGGGNGFCARDNKFGGAAFCPRKPIAINTRYVRCAVEPPRYTLMQCIWNNL